MSRKSACVTGLAAFVALGFWSLPASAQVKAATHEVHAFAGWMFGDDLTETDVSGLTPELDDDFTFGARYVYNFTEMLGLDASFGYTPGSATNLTGGDIDLDVITLDVDAMWSFSPTAKFVPYVLGGVGYAFADLDQPITGTVNGQPVVIEDDDGFTLNAGVGARYILSDAAQLRFEARYRFVDKLVDEFDDSLNTFEATVGAGMTF